jgi:hypothetical protein
VWDQFHNTAGAARRELLDHVIVLTEEHLKRLLKEFIEEYYHLARPHQGLNCDTPVPSAKPEPIAAMASRWFLRNVSHRFTGSGSLGARRIHRETLPAADVSRLVSIPVVGGLHHRYTRVAA